MLWRSFRRSSRQARGRYRFISISLFFAFIIDFFVITLTQPPSRRVSTTAVPRNFRTEKVFIASIHRNSEWILWAHWNQAVVNLTKFLGPDKVYVSVLESGSQDGTKASLQSLDMELTDLGVRTSIQLDKTVEEQVEEISTPPITAEEGWIFTSRGRLEMRRIPYLAKLRNRVMDKLAEEAALGRKYDIVLWLNDVVFTTEDIVTLLATRKGFYDAVCSLDFSKPSVYYDTFALRDSLGSKVPLTWPYFLSGSSRHALQDNQPVPVQSCWNGIVAFHSEPFYASPPLRFRGVSDSLAKHHLEGSECCLVHADYHREDSHGVWVNPNVRVGYNLTAYDAVNPAQNDVWPPWREKIRGVWGNRLTRLLSWPRRAAEDWRVRSRVKGWEREKEGNHEEGVHCLVNEMQVLFQSGWVHV